MTNNVDWEYLKAMRTILQEGTFREGRNGGTYSLFGYQMRVDLSKGFPLLTTKKVNFKAIVVELLWFLKGDTNVKYLHDNDVHIWDEWADKDGDLGPVYGAQWRSWVGTSTGKNSRTMVIDQIANVIKSLKEDPYSRRHIVTAWNPAEIEEMALPPCHCLFQFHVANGKLNCQLYQRSADWFLGVPFNIASYALLTHIIANATGLEVGTFIHTFGDLHIYENHIEQCKEQMSRMSRDLPLLSWNKYLPIDHLTPNSFTLEGYDPHPYIKAPISA